MVFVKSSALPALLLAITSLAAPAFDPQSSGPNNNADDNTPYLVHNPYEGINPYAPVPGQVCYGPVCVAPPPGTQPAPNVPGGPQSAPQNAPPNTSQGNIPNALQGNPPNALQGNPPNALQGNPPNALQGNPPNALQGNPPNAHQGGPQNSPQSAPQNAPQESQQNSLQNALQSYPQGTPDAVDLDAGSFNNIGYSAYAPYRLYNGLGGYFNGLGYGEFPQYMEAFNAGNVDQIDTESTSSTGINTAVAANTLDSDPIAADNTRIAEAAADPIPAATAPVNADSADTGNVVDADTVDAGLNYGNIDYDSPNMAALPQEFDAQTVPGDAVTDNMQKRSFGGGGRNRNTNVNINNNNNQNRINRFGGFGGGFNKEKRSFGGGGRNRNTNVNINNNNNRNRIDRFGGFGGGFEKEERSFGGGGFGSRNRNTN
ncbi:hypothetical protein RUND412_008879, partial [Rhizina undulata]